MGTSHCFYPTPYTSVEKLSNHTSRLSKQECIYCNEEEGSPISSPMFTGIFLTEPPHPSWLSMEIEAVVVISAGPLELGGTLAKIPVLRT